MFKERGKARHILLCQVASLGIGDQLIEGLSFEWSVSASEVSGGGGSEKRWPCEVTQAEQ